MHRDAFFLLLIFLSLLVFLPIKSVANSFVECANRNTVSCDLLRGVFQTTTTILTNQIQIRGKTKCCRRFAAVAFFTLLRNVSNVDVSRCGACEKKAYANFAQYVNADNDLD